MINAEIKMKGLRRSLHFVPGGNSRMLSKALSLPADSLILDLEDSVPAADKAAVRDEVCDWLRTADFGTQEKLVRINPLNSPWGKQDLEAIMQCAPDGIVLPKVVDRSTVEAVDGVMQQIDEQTAQTQSLNNKLKNEQKEKVPVVLIGTEVAAAVFNLPQMANHPRVSGITWGAEDLSMSLGARAKRDVAGNYLEVFSFVRSMCLLSAVAAGVQPIDAVYVDIKNTSGLEAESETAADMGFTGKISIHPSQLEIINAAFTPSKEEIDRATALLEAFEENQAAGRMAFSFNGEMVDVPHLKRAEQILSRAKTLLGVGS